MSGDEDNSGIWAELRAQRDILVELRTLLSPLSDDVKDHEARIRRLEERDQYREGAQVPWGKLASIATVLATLVAVITWYNTAH